MSTPEVPSMSSVETVGETGGDTQLVTDARGLDEIAGEFRDLIEEEPQAVDEVLPLEDSEAEGDGGTEAVSAEQLERVEGRLSPSARPAIDAPTKKLADGPRHEKVLLRTGTGSDTYAQQISDGARERDLGYVSEGEVLVSPDHDKGTVAAVDVAMDRLRELEAQGETCKPVICEVDTDTGHQSQAALRHVADAHPDVYERDDFRVVVTGKPERLEELRGSGAFDEHIRANKVEFKPNADDDEPAVEEGTLLAFARSPSDFPVTRLYRDRKTNDIHAVSERTFIRKDRVVVGVDGDEDAPMPRALWPDEAKLVVRTDGINPSPHTTKISSLLVTEPKPDDVTDTAIGRRMGQVRKFMDGWPAGYWLRNYQPEVPAAYAAIAGRARLVYTNGFLARGNQTVRRADLSRQQGPIVSHVAYADLVQAGAEAVGAHMFMPAGQPGRFNHILIDNSPDAAQREATAIRFGDAVTANSPASVLFSQIRQALAQERDGIQGSESPLQLAERRYQAYIQAHTAGRLDYDLALAISRELQAQGRFHIAGDLAATNDNGYYEAAIMFAERAIAAAPQLAAGAHTERARALIALERFEDAQSALQEAVRISPRDPNIHRTRARLAVLTGDDETYANALTALQRYTPAGIADAGELNEHERAVRETELTVRAWQSICEARERLANQETGTVPRATLMYRYDRARGGWIREVSLEEVSLREMRLQEVATLALAAALAAEEGAPKGQQDELIEPLLEIFDRTRPTRLVDGRLEPIPLDELAPQHLQYIGEDALRVAELAEAANAKLPPARLPSRLSVAEKPQLGVMSFATRVAANETRAPEGRHVIPIDALNTPAVLTGRTGSGKTTTVGHVVRYLSDNGIHWDITDGGVSPSYGALVAQRQREGRPVYYWRVTDPAAPTMDILNPGISKKLLKFAGALTSWIQTLSNAQEPFTQLAKEGFVEQFAIAGFDIDTASGTPSLQVFKNAVPPALMRTMDGVMYRAKKAGYGRLGPDIEAFMNRRILMIKRLEYILGGRRPICMEEAYDEMDLILEVCELSDEAELRSVTAAWNMKKELYLNEKYGHLLGRDLGLRHVSIYEEAQRIFRTPDNAEQIAQVEAATQLGEMLTGWRKLGQGTILATPAPDRLIPQVWDAAGLIVAGQYPNRRLRAEYGATMNMTEQQIDMWGTLKRGEAFISLSGSTHQSRTDLVIIDEPDDHDLPEVQIGPPPLKLIRGGHRPSEGPPYTNDEYKAAYRAVRARGHARTMVWVSSLTVAHEANAELAGAPEAVRRWWQETDLRTRECELDAAIDLAVDGRGIRYEAELKVQLREAAINILNEGLAVGRKPGTRHIVPELVWWDAVGERAMPYAGQPPLSHRALARPILNALPGVSEVPMKTSDTHQRSGEQWRMLLASRASIWRKNSNNLARALHALQASGLSAFLEAAYGYETTGFSKQLRRAEIDMGLVKEGDPWVGPLTKLFTLPERVTEEAIAAIQEQARTPQRQAPPASAPSRPDAEQQQGTLREIAASIQGLRAMLTLPQAGGTPATSDGGGTTQQLDQVLAGLHARVAKAMQSDPSQQQQLLTGIRDQLNAILGGGAQ